MKHYDAIVIGTGQAGPALAVRLSGAGRQVAIIEHGRFGGTCVNNGCTPTKTLIASAYVAHMARRAGEFGIRLGAATTVDMPAVKARKDAVVAQSSAGLEKWLRSQANLTIVRGHARFLDSRTVRVGEDTLSADSIFINVGGRPLLPRMPGIERVRYLTSESIMDLDILPGHLIVVGGSYVGLEFSQMYRRFGSRVTVVEMGPRLIGREDPEVSEAVRNILAGEGIEFRCDAKCIALDSGGDSIRVSLDCTSGAPVLEGTHVLLAVGRTPNTDDLGAAQAGLELDGRGYIRVDDRLRTSVPNVYALGDCNGRGAFTHTAWNDYEIVADNLLDGADRKVTDRISIYGLFTDPPLGRIGLTEAEAKSKGLSLLVGTRPMSQVARAREKGETQGFMKILVDASTRQILGAAILGVGGDEAVQSLVDAMYARLPYTAVQRGVRIHPTVSELIPTVLESLAPVPAAGSAAR
ncbi:MAG: FAD-containing oxidoreductase [Proteobacteria bacterium]|nr:FAD-containing oxidoreductase [Pseudomonadota bacterium]